MTRCEMLSLDQVTEEDLEILREGVERSENDPHEVREALLEGKALLWRVSGPGAKGLVLTQEKEYKREPALLVWIVCGEGAKVVTPHVWETLTEFSRLRGLKRMWGVVYPRVHEHISAPLGYEIDQYVVSKEV